MMDIMDKYEPMNPATLNRIPRSIQAKLFKLYGRSHKSNLQTVHEKIQELRERTYIERLIRIHGTDGTQTKQDEFDFNYIRNINESNTRNDIYDFMAMYMYIFDNVDEKRHGLVLGPANTGKTMVMSLLLSGLHHTTIAKNSKEDRFQLSRLTHSQR